MYITQGTGIEKREGTSPFDNKYFQLNTPCLEKGICHVLGEVEFGRGSSDSRLFYDRFLRPIPFSLRDLTSPSASHRLAFTNWITLMICFRAMTGKLMPAKTQGQKLSILLARASSRAPAL